MEIQWYPGHMTKAKRQLIQKLKLIDIIIEVLDARAPISSLNPDFNDLFKDKMHLYILNKSDVANDEITEQWVNKLNKEGNPTIAYSIHNGNIKKILDLINSVAKPFLNKYAEKGVNKVLRGLVAGIPNVGKSAILNRLIGRKKLNEGNKPGVTRSLQWAKINPYLEIMDSPGLLWPKFDNEETGAILALIGCVKTEILNEEELAYYLIKRLLFTDSVKLIDRYDINKSITDPYQVLLEISKKRGYLLKGAEPDIERTSKTILDEFKNGKLGKISLENPTFLN